MSVQPLYNTFSAGVSTASPGSTCHCLTFPTVERFFGIFNLNLLLLKLQAVGPRPSLCNKREKVFSLFLWHPFRYLRTASMFPLKHLFCKLNMSISFSLFLSDLPPKPPDPLTAPAQNCIHYSRSGVLSAATGPQGSPWSGKFGGGGRAINTVTLPLQIPKPQIQNQHWVGAKPHSFPTPTPSWGQATCPSCRTGLGLGHGLSFL